MSNGKHNSISKSVSLHDDLEAANLAVSDDELDAVKPDFLRAASRAESIARKRQTTVFVWRSLAKAAAIFLVLVGLTLASRYTFSPEEVIAARFDNFTAVVISTITNKVVPGVEVYQIQTVNGVKQNEFMGSTNPNGFITFSLPKIQESAKFEFKLDNEKIGEVELGGDETDIRGIYQVLVNVKLQELEKKITVTLEPGQHYKLGSFVITLDEAANASWDGYVSLNRNWPAIFNYGDVLDGIISMQGAANPWITIALELPKDFDFSKGPQLKLVSHDPAYENSEPGWKSRFHRGWYNTGNPPAKYLPSEQFGTLSTMDDSWIKWPPRMNSKYVILRTPPQDGEVAACFRRVVDEGGLVYENRSLEFINQEQPHIWLYEWLYYPTDGTSPYFFPEYYHKSHHSLSLEASLGPRGALEAGYKWPPLIVRDELRMLPGEFSANRFDFTTCDPIGFPRVKADFTQPAGDYRFEISKGEVGEISRITLKGQLNRLAGPPKWDTDTNLVADSFGNEIELLIPSFGSYHVSAQLQEKNGNIVLLKTKLNFHSDDVVGYLQALITDYPVVKGLDSPPEESGALWVMSSFSTSNLQAHSYSIGDYAGPLMYVDPPQEFKGVPLKEVRLIVYISPRSGDYEKLPLALVFEPVTKTPGLEYPFEQDPSFSPILEKISTLSAHGMSWIVRQALAEHYKEPSANGAVKVIESRIHHNMFPVALKRFFGLDILDLPSEDELVMLFEEFTKSDTYNIHYVTKEHQELTMTLPLPDSSFGPDTGFYVGTHLHTLNLLLTAQWEVFSGLEYPTRVELETLDGRVYTQFFDYSRDY